MRYCGQSGHPNVPHVLRPERTSQCPNVRKAEPLGPTNLGNWPASGPTTTAFVIYSPKRLFVRPAYVPELEIQWTKSSTNNPKLRNYCEVHSYTLSSVDYCKNLSYTILTLTSLSRLNIYSISSSISIFFKLSIDFYTLFIYLNTLYFLVSFISSCERVIGVLGCY
jgi:hypothetical protein